jgi:hypothetical protein
MITGVRGLCNGLGPAMFGLIFSLFHVDLNEKVADNGAHRLPTPDQVLNFKIFLPEKNGKNSPLGGKIHPWGTISPLGVQVCP